MMMMMMLHYASSLWAWVATCSGFRITNNYRYSTTAGRAPLFERSARLRGRYLNNTQQTRQKKKPWRQRDSNPQSQQSSECRPKPYTAGLWLTLRSKLLYAGLNTEGWEMARFTSPAGKACWRGCCVCEVLQEWSNVSRWRVRLSGEARQLRAIRSSVEIPEKQNT